MLKLYDLKANERTEPLGIGQIDYFSWKLESDVPSTLQTAFHIEISNLWDSGRIESRQQAYVEYAGPVPAPCTEYTWRVTVWDNHGNEASAESRFEIANLGWQAKWAECGFARKPGVSGRFGEAYPAVLFQRSFALEEKPVRRARLYATATGVYRASVNGVRPDGRELAPEFTSYDKIHYYQTYDVTALLRSGVNELTMLCADGWYFNAQTCPILGERRAEPSVIYEVHVEYKDGTKQSILSDGSETCSLGAIRYSDLFIGEKQDLRLEYSDPQPVEAKDHGYSALIPQPTDPIVPVMELPAVEVFTSPKGETIVDFGQVISGRTKIALDLPEGAEVSFDYFEVLDNDGNYINTMFAPQTDIVVSNGSPVTHEALFTFHGFRYLRVTGMEPVRKEDFTAVVLSTQKENAGDFSCLEPRLNRLYQNIRWSQRNNLMCVPSDCPTREKAGWTGDILVYAPTALNNENVTPLLTGWLRNLRSDMTEDGVVRIVAPFERLYEKLLVAQCEAMGSKGQNNVAGWSDAVVWVPYAMYRATGNRSVLRENFEAMERFCANVIYVAREDSWLYRRGFHFGEWLIPSEPVGGFEICRQTSPYIAPFFAYESMKKMAEICRVLGQDGGQYESAAQEMKTAILSKVKLPEKMGAYVLAFAFGLVPDGKAAEYKAKLLSLIEKNGGCLDTGFLATPFLMEVLCDLGETGTAKTVFWQNKMPSWLYEVEQGATTIWEAWNADEARRGGRFVSFDHYAFGCIDDFVLRRICGIERSADGNRLRIAPQKDERVGDFRRCLTLPAGELIVERRGEALNVTLPPNLEADVLWNRKEERIGSGTYTFK